MVKSTYINKVKNSRGTSLHLHAFSQTLEENYDLSDYL